jgi:hypothetical protein
MNTSIGRYMALLLIGFVTPKLSNAQTVTIGTGTGSTTTAPISRFNEFSATESIYLGSEFNAANGYITKLAYDKASGNTTTTTAGVSVYMKYTLLSTVGTANYTTTLSDYTLVWSGAFPNSASGWQEIILNTPFAAPDANHNLAILIVNNSGEIISGRPQYRYTTTASRRNADYGAATAWDISKNLAPHLERPNIRFFVDATTPLSLKLKGITATNNGNINIVKWEATTEEPGEYYELERGYDGLHFQTLTKIEVKGLEASQYLYEDHTASSGASFYRLKMADKYGKVNYSPTVTTFMGKGANNEIAFQVFPNPASSSVKINLGNILQKEGLIYLRNIRGKTLQRIPLNGNQQVEVSLEGLPEGLYFLHYNNVSYKFMKKN